jgi:nitrate/nitrite transporter NarK
MVKDLPHPTGRLTKGKNPKVAPAIKDKIKHYLTMMSLIMAGETIFLPAFHLGRYFKSSLLETYGIDEFQLGQLGALYGTLAMFCYLLGGPLADRISPRKMLTGSLLITALGSVYMATVPSFQGMKWLYAFWGISTILGFWAPLIRATREWAGKDEQGRAFGILDGGRGLASAVIAWIAANVFAMIVGGQAEPDPDKEAFAIHVLVYSYAGYCLLSAACIWFFVPESNQSAPSKKDEHPSTQMPLNKRIFTVLRSPAIWLQAIVIIAAYSAFKMFDNYGLYAEDAYGMSRTTSAKLIAYVSFLRAGAALSAGFVADRWLGTRPTIQLCFALLLGTYAFFLFVSPQPSIVWWMVGSLALSCVAFFSLRGIYFALLEDTGIPRYLTGTAVGVISFVGFTPEIYMGPMTGWLIREAREGGDVLVGYQQIFWILAGFCFCGMAATFALRLFILKNKS